MNTLKEIAKMLLKAQNEKILLFPHVNMDGDALGSSAALCSVLRKLGKTAYILTEDDTAYNIEFLDRGYCARAYETAVSAPDVCICMDCGSTDRFAARAEIFENGAVSVCIDHHITSKPIFDMNYIDGSAAATGEIVYDLIKELEDASGRTLFDTEIGEAIFAAIATDTGNFQYSNTTEKSHLIAAALLKIGTDESGVCVKLYQNAKLSRIKLNAAAVDKMKLFAGGRAAIAAVTQDMINACDADMSEADGIAETMRNIHGVEISVLLKEYGRDEVKVSMRAKSYADVAKIATGFGGGGHVRAAGCTLRMKISEAEKIMTEAVSEALQKEMQ